MTHRILQKQAAISRNSYGLHARAIVSVIDDFELSFHNCAVSVTGRWLVHLIHTQHLPWCDTGYVQCKYFHQLAIIRAV